MKFAPLFFLKIMIRGLTNTQKSGAYYSLMNNRPLVYDNVNIKFTKNDRLKITNFDHIYSSRESRTSFVL